MSHLRGACVAIAASVIVGCAPMVQSGGFDVYKDTFDEGLHSVVAQAAFATGCAPDHVQIVVLAVDPYMSHLPTSMGASACGKKLVYARIPGAGTWVLNSDSGSPAAPPAAK